VLQGSKVILDVEEEGIDKRSILSLDAATEISSSGITCFQSSDGKEHCFADAEQGDCSSFADPEGRRQLGIFKKAKNLVSSTSNSAGNAASSTANTAVNTISNTANTAVNTVSNAANTAVNAVDDTANNSINSMKAIALGPVYQAAVEVTNDAMKTAKVADAALAGIEAGAKVAGQALMVGVTQVAAVGVLIAEWVEANYCEIGVSIALGTFFATLLYRPEPSSQATTTAATAPLSTTAIAYLAAKETVGATVLGIACDFVAEAFVTLLLLVSDIKNAIGSAKDILIDAIGMSLAKSIDVAAGAMVIPQSCAAVVAGVITTLTAQLVCKKTIPQGAAEWGLVVAGSVRMLEEDEDGWEGGN